MRRQPAESSALRRAVVLGALATLLTATGHLVAGGTVVGLSPIAVLVPLLVTVLVGVADRCRGVVAVLATLGLGQLGLHLLLAVLSAHDHSPGAGLPADAAMVAAHAAVSVVMAVLVCHADAAFGAVAGLLRRILPRRPSTATADAPLPTRPAPHPDVPLRAVVDLIAAHARRGPPRAC